MGTPCYMSPEQAWGDRRKLDARSDVFLLGALLYEVLTRRPPYVAAEAIVREGEPGDAAYIIVSGRCEVRRRIGDVVQGVSSLAVGEVFGEMAILSSGPRTATVVASEQTTVLVVTRAALEQEMAALKPWVAKLLKSVAEKFRDVDARNRALEPDA